MPITDEQSQRIAAYYEARKPYNELLLEALADAPPNQPRIHPLKKEKKSASTEQPKQEGERESKPGELFVELVEMLREHKISKPEQEKKGDALKK